MIHDDSPMVYSNETTFHTGLYYDMATNFIIICSVDIYLSVKNVVLLHSLSLSLCFATFGILIFVLTLETYVCIFGRSLTTNVVRPSNKHAYNISTRFAVLWVRSSSRIRGVECELSETELVWNVKQIKNFSWKWNIEIVRVIKT